MPNASLTRKSAGELVALVKSREITPVEILDAHLSAIDRINPKLNAIVTLVADQARALAIEAGNAPLLSFLDAPKIREGVMLDRIEKNDVLLGKGRIEGWQDIAEVRVVGEDAIAVIDEIGAAKRQIFLVGLPTAMLLMELVRDRLAKYIAGRRN